MCDGKSSFKHLRRLDQVWIEPALFFVTTCVDGRLALLANELAASILRDQFAQAPRRYGWQVGRYVIMPNHLHFFCAPAQDCDAASLSAFVGGVKMWSARAILAATGRLAPLWQREFFDHVLRSGESYEQKWEYVRQNPVRAGLVKQAEDWPFAGEIERIEFCERM